MRFILIASVFVALISITVSQQLQKQTLLLKLQVSGPTNSSLQTINNLIHELKYEQFIPIQQKQCPPGFLCPIVNLLNAKGVSLYSSSGELSPGRLRQMIIDNIKDRNYETKQIQEGSTNYQILIDQDKSIRLYQINTRLLDKQEQQDWQKANLSINRKTNTQRQQKKTTIDVQKTIKLINPREEGQPSIQKDNIPSNNGWLWWKLFYAFMIIVLLSGMNFMRKQEERVDKMLSRSDEDEVNQLNTNVE